MARLVTLLLNGNQLVGQIPDAIRGAMALERFAVDNNQLTGVLTASVGKLTNLASLCAPAQPVPRTAPCPCSCEFACTSAFPAPRRARPLLCADLRRRGGWLGRHLVVCGCERAWAFLTGPRIFFPAHRTLTGNRFRSWDPAFDCSWAGIADFSCGDNKWACVSATWCLLSVVQGMDASCAQVCASPSGRRRQLIGRDGGGAT